MNGRRRVRGWGASGCSNLTWSGRARDVTKKLGCIGLCSNLTCFGRGAPGMLQSIYVDI